MTGLGDKSDDSTALKKDLDRLVRLGWRDLSARPEEYRVLSHRVGLTAASGTSAAEHEVRRFLFGVLLAMPDRQAAAAWTALLGLDSSEHPPAKPDERRERARVQLAPGTEIRPDTFRRKLELPRLYPRMGEALNGLHHAADWWSPVDKRQGHRSWLTSSEEALMEARIAFTRQHFSLAEGPLSDILRVPISAHPEPRELLLRARAHSTLGDLYRDTGRLRGQGGRSAGAQYVAAASLFREADEGGYEARVQLMLAVLIEMGARGDARQLEKAAKAYQALSDHPLLTPVDRARASMWAGSALSKLSQGSEALRLIEPAQQWLVDHSTDVVGSHLKLAAANLACVDQSRGARADRADEILDDMDVMRRSMHIALSPLLSVRLNICRAQVLLERKRTSTRSEALDLLGRARGFAISRHLGHQVQKIDDMTRARAPERWGGGAVTWGNMVV